MEGIKIQYHVGFSYGFKDCKFKISGVWKNLTKTWRSSNPKINGPLFKMRRFFVWLQVLQAKYCGLGENLTKTGLKIMTMCSKFVDFFIVSRTSRLKLVDFEIISPRHWELQV